MLWIIIEYLLDANMRHQQAVDELGTPRSLARKILADYSSVYQNKVEIRLQDEHVPRYRQLKIMLKRLVNYFGTIIDAYYDSHFVVVGALFIALLFYLD